MRHSLFANEDGNGFRVLLEQASHEIHRGAYDIGLQYLNRALTVKCDVLLFTLQACQKIF